MVRPEQLVIVDLDVDPAAAKAFERWLQTIEPVAPSPDVWKRILRSLALEPEPEPDDGLVN